MYLLRVISMKDCEQTHSTLNFIKVNACPDLHVSAGNNLHCSWRRLLVVYVMSMNQLVHLTPFLCIIPCEHVLCIRTQISLLNIHVYTCTCTYS